jgi:hypothetical protein
MRRSARVFSIIRKQLPGSVLYGDFLAVGKTDMFLRGFRLFTSGRKNHNDLRRCVMPLWRPHDQPSFDFGGRYGGLIRHPQTYWTITDPRDDRYSAAVVLEQIMPFVSEFEGIQTVDSFLDYFDFMRPNGTVPVQLDFALADYLTGDMRGCETALSYVESILANHEESPTIRSGPGRSRRAHPMLAQRKCRQAWSQGVVVNRNSRGVCTAKRSTVDPRAPGNTDDALRIIHPMGADLDEDE